MYENIFPNVFRIYISSIAISCGKRFINLTRYFLRVNLQVNSLEMEYTGSVIDIMTYKRLSLKRFCNTSIIHSNEFQEELSLCVIKLNLFAKTWRNFTIRTIS